MGRGPEINKENIKNVLISLYKGPKSWTELKKETNIQGRIITRILKDYLSYWHLVHKDDNGKWAFITEIPILDSLKEHIALQHSRQIMDDLFSYKKLKYLRGTDFWELSNDVDKIALIEKDNPTIYLQMLRDHLETGYKKTIWKSQRKYESLSKRYDYPQILALSLTQAFNNVKKKRALLKPEMARESIEERIIPEIRKTELEQLKKTLIGDLAKLQLKVLTGTKLEGFCEYCPHVQYETYKEKNQQ